MEDETGPIRFHTFCLLTGVVATLAQTFTDPHAQAPLRRIAQPSRDRI